MTNKPKAIGTACETAVVKLARESGFPDAERLALKGNKDIGDVRLCRGLMAECKAHATYSDAQVMLWLGETERERTNGGFGRAVLVVKRARKPSSHWWAVELVHLDGGSPRPMYMYLGDKLTVLRAAGFGDPL